MEMIIFHYYSYLMQKIYKMRGLKNKESEIMAKTAVEIQVFSCGGVNKHIITMTTITTTSNNGLLQLTEAVNIHTENVQTNKQTNNMLSSKIESKERNQKRNNYE